MVKFEIGPSTKSLSDGTKKVYTSYLNKIAAKGYTTVDDLVKHQKEVVKFIDSHEKKQVKTLMYAAVFWMLHEKPLAQKLAYYNGSQMLKDEQYRKMIPENEMVEENAKKVKEVQKVEKARREELKEKPTEPAPPAPKAKRVIKLKKPAPKPEGPPAPEKVAPAPSNLTSDVKKAQARRIIQDILASLENLAKLLEV